MTGCPASTNGIFYYGLSQTQLPFGDGFQCVSGPPLIRLPVLTTNGGGNAVLLLDYTNPPQPVGQITAGSNWNFQFWYRDGPAGGAGFNLSDALEVQFCP